MIWEAKKTFSLLQKRSQLQSVQEIQPPREHGKQLQERLEGNQSWIIDIQAYNHAFRFKKNAAVNVVCETNQ